MYFYLSCIFYVMEYVIIRVNQSIYSINPIRNITVTWTPGEVTNKKFPKLVDFNSMKLNDNLGT